MGQAAFDPYHQHLHVAQTQVSSGDNKRSPNMCSSYFIEPLQWMDGIVNNGDLTGKVRVHCVDIMFLSGQNN